MKARNGGLLILAAALVVGSVLIGSRREGAEFAGSDGQAMQTVAAIQPDYQPWFGWVWEPPPEIASGLFALQAALGAGILGYYLGFKRGQAQGRRKRSDAGD
ncbi:MAG: Cobalt transport protein cbiN [Proteobacteria bacterium]|nr:Cobalt transport protein cbiN [Pseudomonadota bacterium]MCU0808791.1 energy-coupling factor ABC transporter substrate-binding protein [Candidatus Contendobacter sp.]